MLRPGWLAVDAGRAGELVGVSTGSDLPPAYAPSPPLPLLDLALLSPTSSPRMPPRSAPEWPLGESRRKSSGAAPVSARGLPLPISVHSPPRNYPGPALWLPLPRTACGPAGRLGGTWVAFPSCGPDDEALNPLIICLSGDSEPNDSSSSESPLDSDSGDGKFSLLPRRTSSRL